MNDSSLPSLINTPSCEAQTIKYGWFLTHLRPMFPFYNPPKIFENQWFSNIFSDYGRGAMTWKGLTYLRAVNNRVCN